MPKALLEKTNKQKKREERIDANFIIICDDILILNLGLP
jgi:hypothetical protein